MYRTYTLSYGEQVYAYYNDIGTLIVFSCVNNLTEECILKFDPKSADPAVMYKDEIIKVDRYNYMSLDSLIDAIEHNIPIKTDEFLATFIKERAKLGLMMEVNCFDIVVPGINFGIKSNNGNKATALMVPIEDRYKMKDWCYKIEFQAYDEGLRSLVGIERFYFSDLVGIIKRGRIKVVNLDKLDNNQETYTITKDRGVTVI